MTTWQATVLALALGAGPCPAAQRPCGDLEINFTGKVIADEHAHAFAQLELRNQTCTSRTLPVRGSRQRGFWLKDDESLRWEVKYPGSKQWVARIGVFHVGVPPYLETSEVFLRKGESIQLAAEVPDYLDEMPVGTSFRVYVTDGSGISRSSNEFELPMLQHREPNPAVKFETVPPEPGRPRMNFGPFTDSAGRRTETR